MRMVTRANGATVTFYTGCTGTCPRTVQSRRWGVAVWFSSSWRGDLELEDPWRAA
jgi:hypothetical protein